MTFDNPSVLLTSIAIFMHNFIKILKKFQEIGAVSLQFRYWPWKRLAQSQMTFDNLLDYILPISMCMQSFITIVHSVRPFSLFQNLELGIASIDVKCHFAIFWARFGKILSKYTKRFKGFCQNLNLGRTSTYTKYHLTISLAASCQYQCVCKISAKYSSQFWR